MIGMTASEMAEKTPELLDNIEELQKAVEVIQLTTGLICEWLRVGQGIMAEEPPVPESQPPLIGARSKHLIGLRTSLYEANARLEEILSAVKEI